MANNKKIIECVPNFSEGRDMQKINSIVDAVKSVKGVMLLNVDPGEATNRTVVTFVGEPEAVCEAAFRAVAQAARVIDMRQHHGAHPRIGATDVLPLVPVSGVTLEECAQMARQLAERIAQELRIPCYSYEAAAFKPERRNLAVCRKGEYEALADRVSHPDEAPDFGTRPWDEDMAKSGATVVGARDFLIAVNFNLNTTSTRRANAIAFDVREKGRPMREGGKLTGKILKDADGKTLMQPGTLKGTKAIGWFIDEYGIAQVSMNITNINETPLHMAFDEVCRAAAARGLRVTGTEIVGLIPKRVLIEAGAHYLKMQQRSVGVPEEDLVKIAVKSMSLDDLRPFNPREKVIEYLLEDANPKKRLADMTVKEFVDETSRESPARQVPEAPSRPPWEPWQRLWERWSPTSLRTSADGMTGGRSSVAWPSMGRSLWHSSCTSSTRTQMPSTKSWQPLAYPRRQMRKRQCALLPSNVPRAMPPRCHWRR